MQNNSNYLSIADFAERAGVSKQAVYKRVDKDLQPYVETVDGKKAIHINALTLFNSTDSTETVEQPISTDSTNDLIQQLKLENERLNNQLNKTFDMLEHEQEKNKQLQGEIINISREATELAKQAQTLTSQAQSLQGHMQQQALGQTGSTVETKVEEVETKVDIIDKQVEQKKKTGLFSRLFG